jgi:hypothetical protein
MPIVGEYLNACNTWVYPHLYNQDFRKIYPSYNYVLKYKTIQLPQKSAIGADGAVIVCFIAPVSSDLLSLTVAGVKT